MSDTKKTGGLAGIVAGETAISTVGKEGVGTDLSRLFHRRPRGAGDL